MFSCIHFCSGVSGYVLLRSPEGQSYFASSCLSWDTCYGRQAICVIALPSTEQYCMAEPQSYRFYWLQVTHYHLSDKHVVLVCRAIFKEVHNQVNYFQIFFLKLSAILFSFSPFHLRTDQLSTPLWSIS